VAGTAAHCPAEVGHPHGAVGRVHHAVAAAIRAAEWGDAVTKRIAPDDIVGRVDGVVVVEIAGQPNSAAWHDGSVAAERRDRLDVGVSPWQAIRSSASRAVATSIGYVIVRES
jgi:hypothetical protein